VLQDREVWAIVLAAGSGHRFGVGQKQFALVGGVRAVDRTVETARRVCDHVVVVLPPGQVWDGVAVDAVARGGEHGSDSVRAGLAELPSEPAIAVICDPAHPLASEAVFDAVVTAVQQGADGAVPSIPMHDVIQRVEDGRVVATIPKAGLVVTQSPQAFRSEVLREVHAGRPMPAENSGMVVDAGYHVVSVAGDATNLHVTTPDELAAVDEIAMIRKL
jgi:2-C-methyl-D-erythritol 4-phosphate cytidylyltransferase